MKHYARLLALTALFFSATLSMLAQETWTLERAIRHAQENNLSLKQSRATVRTALLTERAARAARLPNVSGQINAGEQFGRTIDPTTNIFSNTAVGFSSLSLSAGANLFQGGLVHHSIKQADWDVRAAEADVEQDANDLALRVAQAYLSILLAEEQAENGRRRVEQSQRQLENTDKLIQAGTLPQADRFNFLAQIARDEQAVILAQNNAELGYLTLKQLLQLEPDYAMQIERPAVELPAVTDAETLTLAALYQTAQTTQPAIRAGEYRRQSALEGIDIARSGYYPTLSVFANLSSNYSTQFRNAIVGDPVPTNPETIIINGQPVVVSFLQPDISYVNVPYFNQLNQNFGQSVGVSLNIPIYQNNRIRLSVERARLAVLNTELQNDLVRQQLKNDIQTAIANVRAGRQQYEAAERTVEATRMAFQNIERRHQLGAANSLELTTARTNLDVAENDLVVARYEYLFRLKILDFYQGRPLELGR